MLPTAVLGAVLAFLPALALATPTPIDAGGEVITFDHDAAVQADEDGSMSIMSFEGSCHSCSIQFGSVLTCKCRNEGGQSVNTELDLNTCMANAECWLRWRQNGVGFRSCRNVGLVDGVQLVAECVTGGGVWCPNRIDLNTNVHNWNGNLGCSF